MKYRTVIELICEASDREEAVNMVGEYLKGSVDFGVEMSLRSTSIKAQTIRKYAVSTFVALLVFSSLFFRGVLIGGEEKIQATRSLGATDTYTIMPALKTKHKADFKKEWERKKNETIIDHLRK